MNLSSNIDGLLEVMDDGFDCADLAPAGPILTLTELIVAAMTMESEEVIVLSDLTYSSIPIHSSIPRDNLKVSED